jgi:L-amino acid N-acyltransferase YncA
MKIRDATAADLPEILAIYNDAVLTTTAIWNESVVDLDIWPGSPRDSGSATPSWSPKRGIR